MVDFKKLGQQAKSVVDKRGGTDALKADASQLADIAKGKGSISDKAKAAAAALKDPGADGTRAAPATDAAENRAEAAAEPPVPAPTAEGQNTDRDGREGRGGQGRGGGGGGRGKHRREGGGGRGRGRDDV
jgi:hypothetical protein